MNVSCTCLNLNTFVLLLIEILQFEQCPNFWVNLYIMKILCRRGKFRDTEKAIRYPPFGIGIGADIVFGISVPESTAGITEIPEYRISFNITSSVEYQKSQKVFFMS